MNGNAHTHFQDEAKLTSVTHAKYLGITLDEKAPNKPDVNARFTATLATITTLKIFWKSSVKPKWAILVCKAVVGTAILYGLDSLQLNDQDHRRLDAFQQRGLRRIFGTPLTHGPNSG